MLVLHHHMTVSLARKKFSTRSRWDAKAWPVRDLPRKALHAIAEGRHVLVRDHRFDSLRRAGPDCWARYSLIATKLLARVAGQIDDRKPAQGELMLNAVFIELVAGRKGWFACCAIDIEAIMGFSGHFFWQKL